MIETALRIANILIDFLSEKFNTKKKVEKQFEDMVNNNRKDANQNAQAQDEWENL